jgi:hypothetical protein
MMAGLEVAGAEREHRLFFRNWGLTGFRKNGTIKILRSEQAAGQQEGQNFNN